jgi:hypothetical protein
MTKAQKIEHAEKQIERLRDQYREAYIEIYVDWCVEHWWPTGKKQGAKPDFSKTDPILDKLCRKFDQLEKLKA